MFPSTLSLWQVLLFWEHQMINTFNGEDCDLVWPGLLPHNWNAFSGTAQMSRFPTCFFTSVAGGLYVVVEHQELQRYDLCVYCGGRIGLWDLILWKWQGSLMCQTLTGRQAQWRESLVGKCWGFTPRVLCGCYTYCVICLLFFKWRSEWLRTCGFNAYSLSEKVTV